jgi:hypothetical protein
MSFTHPATGETMTVEAPLPAALVDFVGRLDLPAGPARTDAAVQAAASEPAAAPRRRSPTGDR